MNGGDEGGGRKTDWPLVISIAALLFGIVQFVIALGDDSQANAVKMENRVTTIEGEQKAMERRVSAMEARSDRSFGDGK